MYFAIWCVLLVFADAGAPPDTPGPCDHCPIPCKLRKLIRWSETEGLVAPEGISVEEIKPGTVKIPEGQSFFCLGLHSLYGEYDMSAVDANGNTLDKYALQNVKLKELTITWEEQTDWQMTLCYPDVLIYRNGWSEGNFVSFTAHATSTNNYNVNDIVTFDHVVRNYGNGYSQKSSRFTCPVTGYYQFSISLLNGGTGGLSIGIMLGDERVVSSYVSTRYYPATTSTVVYCEKNQEVFVKCFINGAYVYGSSYRFSTFTGTLLFDPE